MSTIQTFTIFAFVIINTYFSFRAGRESGKWEGIIGTMRFLKDEKALKGKTLIKGYQHWPESLKKAFTNPYSEEFE